MRLESDSEILLRVSKDLLAPRGKRQQFSALLRELEERIAATLGEENEAAQVVRSMLGAIEKTERHAQLLANELLGSGLLENRLEDGINARFERHVQDNAARAQAEIAQRVDHIRGDLEALQRERDSLQDEIASKRRRAIADVDRDVAAKRLKFEDEIRGSLERLARQERELEEQRDMLSRHLESVVARFTQSRHDIVNQFLELQPLFEATGLLRGQRTEDRASTDAGSVPKHPEPAFALPAFVESQAETWPEIGESEFFERFRRHVVASGFAFRDLDLASFHIAVKCCDITVVGGVSGTGKSSLPRLYLEALAGSDPAGAERFLNVAGSAWR